MVEEKAALILDSQENEEKTLHPPRGPRFKPQKGKLSSKNHTVTNVKTMYNCICRKKECGEKIHYPLIVLSVAVPEPAFFRQIRDCDKSTVQYSPSSSTEDILLY